MKYIHWSIQKWVHLFLIASLLGTSTFPSGMVFAQSWTEVWVEPVMIDGGGIDASISETIISGEVSSMSGEVLSGSTVMTSSGDLVSNSGSINYATGSLPPADTEFVGNTSTSWNPENEIIEEFLMPWSVNESEGVPYVEGELIVKFHEENVNLTTYMGEYALDTMAQSLSLETVTTDENSNSALLSMEEKSGITSFFSLAESTSNETTRELIEKVQEDPRVEYVQPNYVYYAQAMPNDPAFSAYQANLYNSSSTGLVRSDIHYPEAMDMIASWSAIEPTIVAVLDMGVAYDHPDLKNKMWDGSNCKDYNGNALGNCSHGFDLVDSDTDPRPAIGPTREHGTHVAGIIGAESNNTIGMAGIAPNAQIMSVRIMGAKEKPFATTMTLSTGINFARVNGAKVINASYGSFFPFEMSLNTFDQLMYTTIKTFPGLFIAAAGNDGSNTDTRVYLPAGMSQTLVVPGGTISSGSVVFPGLDNIISVGATDSNDIIASFSNYGTNSVDIGAPGKNIYSTIPNDVGAYQGNLATLSQWSEAIPDGDATTWTGRLNSSGEIITIDGVPGFWPDTKSIFTKNARSDYQMVIPNTRDYASIGVTVKTWCDSPYQTFMTPNKDFLEVEVSGNSGSTFTSLGTIHENSLSYLGTSVIEGHTGGLGARTFAAEVKDSESLILRFRWSTDALDDVDSKLWTSYYGCSIGSITYASIDNGQWNRYIGYNGTSMATPQVSGAAAIAWGLYPNASPSDIKKAILAGADRIPGLSTKIAGGRRLNLAGMISVLRSSLFSNLNAQMIAGDSLRFTLDADSPVFAELRYASRAEDVRQSPYYRYAEVLAQTGVIPAQSYTGYQLSKNMSRADFAILLARTVWVNPGLCYGNIFLDILGTPGDTCGYIEELVRQNYIEKDVRYFSPYASITRVEVIRMLAYAFRLQAGTISHGYTDTSMLGNTINTAIQSFYERQCIRPANKLQPLAFIPRGESYKLIACVLGLWNSDISESIMLEPSTHQQIDISWLQTWREYFYGVTSAENGGLSEAIIHDVHSFFLPVPIRTNFSGSAVADRMLYFPDATSLGVDFSVGGSSGEVLLSDTGGTASVRLPMRNLKIQSSQSWDRLFHAPTRVHGFSGITVSGSLVPIQSLHSMGGSGTSLSLSGAMATVRITVPQLQNGRTVVVYRAPSIGDVYTEIDDCIISAWVCEFSTNHFSYFALGEPMGSAPPDTNPPVITLSGASTLSITQGNGYTDAGATCIDNIDPTCTVTVSGSVNTSQTGTYIITYRAVDQAGNQATPITRTIQVQAGVIPPPPIVSPVITPSTPFVQAGPGGGGGWSFASIVTYLSNTGVHSVSPSRIFPTAQSETIWNRVWPKLQGFDLSTISTSNLLNRMVWHTMASSLSRIEQETAPMAKLIRYRHAIQVLDEKIQYETIPRVRSVFEKAKAAIIRSEQEYILRTILKK